MEIKLIEYQPLRPNCPKCGMHGDIGVGVEYIKEKNMEYLKCLCGSCGYWWGMKTEDGEKSDK